MPDVRTRSTTYSEPMGFDAVSGGRRTLGRHQRQSEILEHDTMIAANAGESIPSANSVVIISMINRLMSYL